MAARDLEGHHHALAHAHLARLLAHANDLRHTLVAVWEGTGEGSPAERLTEQRVDEAQGTGQVGSRRRQPVAEEDLIEVTAGGSNGSHESAVRRTQLGVRRFLPLEPPLADVDEMFHSRVTSE